MAALKVVQPKPFYFERGPRAVLLLHGFTGTTADVRMLGRFLEKKDYTVSAPLYKGHGVDPEQLITTGPKDWWQSVVDSYRDLREKGFEEIAVVGLSLGGVHALRLSTEYPIKGVVPMCAPMTMKTTDQMFEGVLRYAKAYKQFQGKEPEIIERELQHIRATGMPSLADLKAMIEEDVRTRLEDVYAPLFVVQARLDEVIDPHSANIIYEESPSVAKELKWYEQSTHIITLGKEKEQLHEDIYQFLETLDWST